MQQRITGIIGSTLISLLSTAVIVLSAGLGFGVIRNAVNGEFLWPIFSLFLTMSSLGATGLTQSILCWQSTRNGSWSEQIEQRRDRCLWSVVSAIGASVISAGVAERDWFCGIMGSTVLVWSLVQSRSIAPVPSITDRDLPLDE